MISELLGTGKENARTCKELSRLSGCDPRRVTIAIEKERRQGAPICATCSGEIRGYNLAKDSEELEEYCYILYHRGGELFKTRRALISVLQKIKEKKEA